jgi:short subunit dehydrogenase-like uncharacterized protein
MSTLPSIAVYGAGGHTGRFVVQEALRRRLPVVAVGRDAARLPSGVPARIATIDDAAALQQAFAGCAVVINCAGPFLDTAHPMAAAALRAGCSYIDVTAEQASALATFEAFDAPARAAGRVVIPAAGFYGGLADLLASALVGSDQEEGQAEEVTVAIALDHWWPTEGTRRTGERNQVPRVVVEGGRLVPMPLPAARSTWAFDAPHGAQPVVELPFSEVATISHHLKVQRLRSWLTTASLDELRDGSTPPPTASDEQGRSAQRFEIVVQVASGGRQRRAVAQGRDIYAVSAPLVVEAAQRLLAGTPGRTGALSLGAAFDPVDFLDALAPAHLDWRRSA